MLLELKHLQLHGWFKQITRAIEPSYANSKFVVEVTNQFCTYIQRGYHTA